MENNTATPTAKYDVRTLALAPGRDSFVWLILVGVAEVRLGRLGLLSSWVWWVVGGVSCAGLVLKGFGVVDGGRWVGGLEAKIITPDLRQEVEFRDAFVVYKHRMHKSPYYLSVIKKTFTSIQFSALFVKTT